MKYLEQIWSTWRKAVMTFVLVGSSIASVLAQSQTQETPSQLLLELAKMLDPNPNKSIATQFRNKATNKDIVVNYFKEWWAERVDFILMPDQCYHLPADDSSNMVFVNQLIALQNGGGTIKKETVTLSTQ